MKLTKKLLAITISAIVVLTMTVTAFAETTYSITINNDMQNHTYEAYQIFAGDLHDGVLSNITWGTGVTEDGKAELGDAEAKAATLTDEAAAKAFANEVAEYLSDVCASDSTMTDGKYVISGLDAGYYLVKDKDNSLTGMDDTYTSYILKVVNNVNTTPKSDKPSVEKKVKDINDSKELTLTEWQDTADHDIGDVINFQLNGTVAQNYDSYNKYFFAFHDKNSAGLTFDPTSVKVYVDGVLITENYEVVTDECTDDCTFEVVFSDLKKIEQVQAGSVVTVEYQCALNENAVLGLAGNANECCLEYSNNPNSNQGGDDGSGGGSGDDDDDDDGNDETGSTPWDKVVVFTYKTIVNKVDPNHTPLAGAEFTLEKYNKTTQNWEPKSVVVTDEGTVFSFKGVDDGQYRLTETKTPEGYNSIEPIYFAVSAEHEEEAVDPVLISLEANQTNVEGVALEEGQLADFTADINAGSLSTDIVNNTGATLPSTGGFGTTVFYVLGSVLVMGAIVTFIVKKRMSYQA